MSRLKGLAARLRAMVRPAAVERRMEEEFAFHVEMETARLRADGVPPDEARRRALVQFGGLDRYREEMRDGRLTRWLDELRSDLRYGAKILWKNKGLTFVAVVSLAAGIGANSAIFSIFDSILLRPRAVSQPDQLLELYSGYRQQPYQSSSYPSYLDFRNGSEVFSGLAAYGVGWQFKLRGASGDVDLVWGEPVSGNYFQVLGVQPHRGRMFLPEEDSVPNRNPVVVIGYRLWQRRFASNPDVIGQSITVNNQPLTVIGVAPPEYSGMTSGWASEIWVPAMMIPALEPSKGLNMLASRGSKWAVMVGRLKPGMTLAQARTRFDLISKTMQAEHPDEWTDQRDDGLREYFVSVLSERETRVHPQMRAPAYAIAGLLFVVVDLVLIIACMNLAGLLFARAVARRSEIAVRLALGARRSRIVRQLLTESVLLSFIAGAAGILLAVWALYALTAFMPPLPEGIRLAIDIRVDWRVVLYTVVFSTITGLLFGLAPALHASRSSVSSVLKDDAATLAGPIRASRSRSLLIVGQVAFSLLLLIGAGLVRQSLSNVRPTQLGFPSENVVVAPLSLDESEYDRRKGHRFYEQLSNDAGALPGVRSVSLFEGMPGGFMSRTRRSTEIEGYAAREGESLELDASVVGPLYFTNMNVPFILGRDFDQRDRDGAPCVSIVNEVFATRYLGGAASALGKHLTGDEGPGGALQRCRIVGVVRDNAWQSLLQEVRPFYALALQQSDPRRRMALLVSSAGAPQGLVPGVRRTIQALDQGIPVSGVQTLRDYFSIVALPFRLLGIVLGGCGVMALLLATVGIYGTVSHVVAQRQREVGIRVALGAERTDILRLVVGQAMKVVGIGLGLGLLLGGALTRVLTILPLETSLLFGVDATDLLTFAGVTGLLALVALTACYVPALKATKVDPMVTLRSS